MPPEHLNRDADEQDGLRAAILLGAGWSAAAGRPLTRDLFALQPYASATAAARAFHAVTNEWQRWRAAQPDAPVEQFITDMAAAPLWRAVVGFIAARLAEPDQVRLEHELRYGERLTKPSPSPLHHGFASKVLRGHELVGIVTTNYDLLAERTFRHRPMARPRRPGFYYAGLPNEPLQGSSTFSVRHKWVHVTGSVPLCKLHGSLNWVSHDVGVRAYADCRPAFRGRFVSYIVAPTREKVMPARLAPVWEAAAKVLASAEVWFAVGYSAPEYDEAVARLLLTAAKVGAKRVHVVDPDATVADRFQALTRGTVIWEGDLERFVTAGG